MNQNMLRDLDLLLHRTSESSLSRRNLPIEGKFDQSSTYSGRFPWSPQTSELGQQGPLLHGG